MQFFKYRFRRIVIQRTMNSFIIVIVYEILACFIKINAINGRI